MTVSCSPAPPPPSLSRQRWALWLATSLAVAAVLGGAGLLSLQVQETERTRALAEAVLAVDAFAAHAADVLNYADGLLHALRWVHGMVGSVSETESFINQLPLQGTAIGNLYLVGPDGRVLISHDARSQGIQVADRAYFRFHQANPTDRLFMTPVELGRVTGLYQFRVTRRISTADGGFGGVALATLDPVHFMEHFASLGIGAQHVASLIGTDDHLLRARLPAPSPSQWALPVDNALWAHLAVAPAGTFRGVSPVDGIERTFAYRKVPDLPLVLLVGFSDRDIADRTLARVGWALPTGLLLGVLILALGALAHSLLGSRARLAELALHDALTGLPSRLLFADRLQGCLLQTQRSAEHCGLLYLDLDDFKAINDSVGHDAGDQVLRAVAARMSAVVRAADTVCRWGGDEFLVLIPRCQARDHLLRLGERLLSAIGQPLLVGDQVWRLAASIGIATSPENGQSAEALRAAADAALLAAKAAGKGRVLLAPPAPAQP